jgi:hypothetical protein
MPTVTDATAIDSATQGLLTAIGGTPTAGDTVIVGVNNPYTVSGQQNMGVNLAALKIQRTHRQRLLSLLFTATAGIFYHGGSGPEYTVSSLGAAGVIATVILDPGSGTTKTTFTDATITHLKSRAGFAILGTDVPVTNALVSGGEVELLAGPAAATLVQVGGSGLVRIRRDLTTGTAFAGGTLEIDGTACSPGTLKPQGGIIRMLRGGNVGTVGATAEVVMGTVDFSRVAQPITVTQLYEHPDLTIILPRHDPSLVTISATDTTQGVSPRVYQ